MEINALVVDDEPVQIKLTSKFLSSLDVHGLTAKNGQEAVDLAQDNKFDICFMDIQMPIMNGIEATSAIKKISPDLPVIAVTSLENFNYEKSIESGMDDYLKKPVTEEDLKRMIVKHCRMNT